MLLCQSVKLISAEDSYALSVSRLSLFSASRFAFAFSPANLPVAGQTVLRPNRVLRLRFVVKNGALAQVGRAIGINIQ